MKMALQRKMSIWIRDKNKKDEDAMRIAEQVKEEDYEVYEPLLVGLKQHEHLASIYNILFLVRRILLVSVIIFLDNKKWVFVQL